MICAWLPFHEERWVAPSLGYLPVKAERVKGKKIEFTMKIQAVER